jgi:O-antigen/teichoic acid export membrane protein
VAIPQLNSVSRRIAFGATAQWAARGVSILLGLVLMPILLRHMPKEEVGLWLLLGQSWAVMGILDLGFGVTLTRKIALAKGKSGATPDIPLTDESLSEIADLIAIGMRIHRYMAVAVLLITCTLGYLYLKQLNLVPHEFNRTLIAWVILSSCQAITVWASTWVCVMAGMGHVGWDALFATTINTITLVLQIISVIFGGGIIALACVATLGVLIQRIILRYFCIRRDPQIFSLRGKWNPAIFKEMPTLSIRAWFATVGTVLVFNTDGFFIASATGAENIPAFRAAVLVVLNLHMLALTFAQSSSVFISQLWQAGEQEQARKIIIRNLRLGASFTICGAAAILFAGESLFNVWLGPSNYVGNWVLLIVVVTYLFEQQSFIISTSCRATNQDPFSVIMMLAGFIKLAMAVLLIHHLGLLGLALSTLIAQMSTTYWFVASHGLRKIGIHPKDYLKSIGPVAAVLAILNLLFCSAARYAWHIPSDLTVLLSVSFASGIVLLIAVWIFVFDSAQRGRIWQSLASIRHTS